MRCGAESAVHATRLVLQNCGNDSCVVKLDFTYAFNSVDKSHLIKCITSYLPELEAHVRASYGAPLTLFFDNNRLTSSGGV